MTETVVGVDEPTGEPAHRHTVHRMTLSADDRRSAMKALMMRPSRRTVGEYSVLLTLSIIVSTMGLLLNSTAVVIGAMMIAPLMAPIMGMSASVVMGWGGRLWRASLIVAASVGGSIALSWALARFTPIVNSGLPYEVVSRASPDIRDLVVALAAGAAGAYATVRRDVSGALPGVAVAVALVPPLAAVGVLLGLGQPDLARGATLLFAANLFGIMFAASIVFLVTGFVPARRRKGSRSHLAIGVGLVAIPVVILAMLLGGRFATSVSDASDLRLATQTALAWLGPESPDSLGAVTLEEDNVVVNLTGASPPSSTSTLADQLTAAFGRPITASVRWIPVQDGDQPAPQVALPLDDVRPIVEAWLAAQSLVLTSLSASDGSLVADTVGLAPPGDVTALEDDIEAQLGTRPDVSISWTLEKPGPVEAPSLDVVAQQAADQWAAGVPGVAVIGVDVKDDGVLVTIVGGDSLAPSQLEAQLAAALPEQVVTVQQIGSSAVSGSATGIGPPAQQ